MRLFPSEIIYDKPGQTCNRLWSYLDSVAKAIATDSKVWILFWDKSIADFDTLRHNPHVKFPLFCKKGEKILGKNYQKWMIDLFGNRLLIKFYDRLGENKGFVRGWKRRNSSEWYPQVMDQVKEAFTPNQEITSEVSAKFKELHDQGFFIIGVHVRRGDYRTWEGGKYYLELPDYAALMRQAMALHPDRKILFFISTNEEYAATEFEGLPLMEANFRSAAKDLYALSLCDRIMGPLSTFSRWASFYGNVPLCFIEKGMSLTSDNDFSPVKEFYRFENGKEIINLTDK